MGLVAVVVTGEQPVCFGSRASGSLVGTYARLASWFVGVDRRIPRGHSGTVIGTGRDSPVPMVRIALDGVALLAVDRGTGLGADVEGFSFGFVACLEWNGPRYWRQLTSIALPQLAPTLVAAWLVGVIIALGDLAASILTVPPGVTTVAIRIFGLMHYGVEDQLAAICLVQIGVMTGLACLVGFLWHRQAKIT